MGWDNYTQNEKSSSDTPTSCTKEQVGMKEYEVEVDVVFTVKYKVLAKDKSDLIEKKMYLAGCDLEIEKDDQYSDCYDIRCKNWGTEKDDNYSDCYEIRCKNWGTEKEKESETGKEVVANIIEPEEPKADDNYDYELEHKSF